MSTEITRIRTGSAIKYGAVLGVVTSLVFPIFSLADTIWMIAVGLHSTGGVLGVLSGIVYLAVVFGSGTAIVFGLYAFTYNALADISGGFTIETN